jgi:hypothetical protein
MNSGLRKTQSHSPSCSTNLSRRDWIIASLSIVVKTITRFDWFLSRRDSIGPIALAGRTKNQVRISCVGSWQRIAFRLPSDGPHPWPARATYMRKYRE